MSRELFTRRLALLLTATVLAAAHVRAQDVEWPGPAARGPATKPDPLAEPTRVTLRLTEAAALDAVAAVAKAAGFRVGEVPEAVTAALKGRRVTVAFDREPLLTALKETCRQAKVEPVFLRLADGGAMLSLRIPQPPPPTVPPEVAAAAPTTPWTLCPAVLNGTVLFTCVTASRTGSLSLTARPKPKPQPPSVAYRLVVLAEPKLEVLALSPFPHIEEALDENGAAIPLEPRAAREVRPAGEGPPGIVNQRGERHTVTVNLRLPREDVAGVSLLRGSVRARVATRRESLSIPFVVGQGEQHDRTIGADTAAALRVTVSPVARHGEEYELRYTLFRESQSDEDWSRLTSQSSATGPQLVDDDGLPLHVRQGSSGRRNDALATFTRRLVRAQQGRPTRGEPVRVVWSVPVEIEEIEIPFEFRDLPVPR